MNEEQLALAEIAMVALNNLKESFGKSQTANELDQMYWAVDSIDSDIKDGLKNSEGDYQ